MKSSLRPHGIKATQLNLLVLLARLGPIKRIELGKLVQLEPSTLTRNLQVMMVNRWVEEVPSDEDGRGLPVQASDRGLALLEAAAPAWARAQEKAKAVLGAEGAKALMNIGDRMLYETLILDCSSLF